MSPGASGMPTNEEYQDNLQLPCQNASLCFKPNFSNLKFFWDNKISKGLIYAKINLDFFVGGACVLENFWQFIPNRNKEMLDD